MATKPRGLEIATAPGGTWVQIERASLEAWAKLAVDSPRAAALMMLIVRNMGRSNALVASVPNLQRLMGCSRNTVLRALDVLRAGNWVEVRAIAGTGTTNAYIVNDRVAWAGARDGIHYSLFSAAVLVSSDDQADRDELGSQTPLHQLPFAGELPIPTGPGLSPPSQPSFDGMEPDLPATEK